MMKYSFLIAIGLLFCGSAFAANLTKSDVNFLKAAVEAGNFEIDGGKMAETHTTNSDVKSYANQMIDDHTAINDELKQLAQSKGVNVSPDPSLRQDLRLVALNTFKGPGFDKRYAKEVGVNAHKRAVKLFQTASRKAKDADVKAFATKALAQLKHHLAMAQSLKATVDAE